MVLLWVAHYSWDFCTLRGSTKIQSYLNLSVLVFMLNQIFFSQNKTGQSSFHDPQLFYFNLYGRDGCREKKISPLQPECLSCNTAAAPWASTLGQMQLFLPLSAGNTNTGGLAQSIYKARQILTKVSRFAAGWSSTYPQLLKQVRQLLEVPEEGRRGKNR